MTLEKEVVNAIDEATDELDEVLQDLELCDDDLLSIRDTIKNRISAAQMLLLSLLPEDRLIAYES